MKVAYANASKQTPKVTLDYIAGFPGWTFGDWFAEGRGVYS